ncbi:glycosyltransferase family 4 protein [Neptunomonas phycophila]|nr:glycosyltransferase family 4 protein [Neptunomonas phycophila]MDO6467091.1 glycosyltransferase family 4 protein [Neptunomonas phycophila]
MSILLVKTNDENKNKCLNLLESLYPSSSVLEVNIKRNTLLHANEVTYEQQLLIEKVEDLKFSRVVFLGIEKNDIVNLAYISFFISKGVKSLQLFNRNEIIRYRPFRGNKSQGILVFPGSIIPINMGSHQRAFNLLASLNYSGKYTDVIITGGNADLIKKSARLLESIACNVYTYKNNKRKLNTYLQYRRFLERKYLEYKGISTGVPELFVDRLSNKATYSLQKTISRVFRENSYKYAIVSYAWMDKCRDLIDHEDKKGVKWICDTHDVQYVRNKTANNNKKRFLSLSFIDKLYEKKVLNSYDAVLAISCSDEDELKKTIVSKVIRVTSSFDYAFRKPRLNENSPLSFGFIGGGMEANVVALNYILDNWWPTIKSYSPESNFFIAGSICNNEMILDRVSFEENIVLMGFVDVVDVFYKKIDVSLNPVLIKGGLNFKSVEAVAFGKVLLTNSMGIECLGGEKSLIGEVIKSEEDIKSILLDFELNSKKYFERLMVSQLAVCRLFGFNGAYDDLREYIDGQ